MRAPDLARFLLPALVAAASLLVPDTPTPLQAQLVMGMGVSEVRSPDARMPRGPGVQTWATLSLTNHLRLAGSVSREWGQDTTWDSVSGESGPGGRVAWASAQVGVEMVAPAGLGFQLSAGGHLSRNRLSGTEPGPLVTPAVTTPALTAHPLAATPHEATHTTGRGWEVGLERAGVLGTDLRVRASVASTRVSIPGCLHAGSPCGDESVRRVALGAGIPLFR
jgi:hypothetical protein